MLQIHWIYSDTVITGGILEPLAIQSARIAIHNGNIVDVVACDRHAWTQFIESSNNDYTFEDLGSDIVSPSFVNSHTHLCMLAFRGIGGQVALANNVVKDLYFRLEEKMLPEDIKAFTRIGAVEAMMMGTGLVWEHYYFGTALTEALVDVGLCGVVASTLQDLAGPGKNRTADAWAETLSIIDNPTMQAKGIVAAVGPHASDTVSDDLWKEIAQLADSTGTPVHAHLAQALDEVEWSWKYHNMSPMTRMQHLGLLDISANRLWVHGLFISEEELRHVNKQRDHLGHCPSAQMQFGFPAHTLSWQDQQLKVLLGTDAGSCNDAINIQSELRFFASASTYSVTMGENLRKFRQSPNVQKARSVQEERQVIYDMRAPFSDPKTVLQSVWGHAGDLHPKAPVGAIEIGRWANLVVWDGNHPCLWPNWDILQGLTTANATPAIKRIMSRGEWKFDGDGYLSTRIMESPKIQEWREEATVLWKDLLHRTNIM